MDPISDRIMKSLSEDELVRLLISQTNNSGELFSKLSHSYQEEIRRRIDQQFTDELFNDDQIRRTLRNEQPVYLVFTFDTFGEDHSIWYHKICKDSYGMMSYSSYDYQNKLIYSRQYRSIQMTTHAISLIDKGCLTNSIAPGTRRFFAKII